MDRVSAKLSNENGAILAGDYLCTSGTKPGFLMKQTGTQKHNYTIAKAVMDITFDQNAGTEKHDAYVILCN